MRPRSPTRRASTRSRRPPRRSPDWSGAEHVQGGSPRMTTETRPSADALLGKLRAEETARRSDEGSASSRAAVAEGLPRRLVVGAGLTLAVLVLALALPGA